MAGERALPRFQARRQLGRTGFQATRVGIGDLADRSVPLVRCVATLHRAMDAGLNVIDTAPGYEDGYSEQIVGEALRGAAAAFQPLTAEQMADVRQRAVQAIEGKGAVWWNP